MKCVFFIGSLILLMASAAIAAPSAFTYQGRILKSDGTPLEYNNVSFIFQVTDPLGTCVLYQEQVDGFDMTNSGGVFDTPIGNGTRVFPTTGVFTIIDSLNNSALLNCQGGSTYTPSADDGRKLRVQFFDGVGWKTVTPDNVIRSVPYAGYSTSAEKLGTNVANDFVLKNTVNSGVTCDSGNFLTWNASTLTFGCAAVTGTSGGTVTGVTSANSYLSVSNPNAAPVLTVNVGILANTLAAGNDSRIVNAIQSGGAAGGDLSGTYPNPSVAKIANVGLLFTTITSGQFLKYNGTSWVNSAIAQSDVTGLSTTLSGYMTTAAFNTDVASASCSTSQTMYWNSVSSIFSCQTISVTSFSGSLTGDVSGSQTTTSVDKIKGVAVSATAPTSNQILQYNGTVWAPTTLSSGTLTALTGDVSASGSGSVAATVNSVGGSTAANVHSAELLANAATNTNTANTIVKRDASGNFTAGTITANLTGAASLNVLKAGDSMTGNLSFATTKGTVYTDTGSNTVSVVGPASAITTSYVLKLPTAQGGANQILMNDGSGNLSWTSPSTTATSYSGVLPIANGGTNSSTTLTNGKIMISSSGAIVEGVATNTLQTTTLTDGKILVGNSSNIATAITPSSDVSMTDAGAFTVAKIQGTAVSATAPTTAGQVLRFNGTNWAANFISMADLRSTITGASALTSCTSGQTLTWSAATDNLACSTISIGASNFPSQTANTFLAAPNGTSGTPTFRAIASADLPAGILSGSGTAGYVPYYSAATTLAISPIAISGGNVGIGTTSPDALLNVNGRISAGTDFKAASSTAIAYQGAYLQWNRSGTDGATYLINSKGTGTGGMIFGTSDTSNVFSEQMRVSDSGSVGIGTASPSGILHTYANGAVLFDRPGGQLAAGSHLLLRASGGSAAAPTTILNGSFLGTLNFSAYDGTIWNSQIASAVQGAAAEDWTATSHASYMLFSTTPTGAVTGSERMRITSSGNVGIGTTSPSTALQVNGTITATAFNGPVTATTTSSGTGSNSTPSMTFSGDPDTGFYDASSNNVISVTAGGTKIWDLSSSGIVSPTTGGADITTAAGTAAAPTYSFAGDTGTGWWRPATSTLAASTGGVERVRIDSSGNVAIGTSGTIARLTVSANTGTLPGVGANVVAQFANVDGTGTKIQADSFASATGLLLRRADGTSAAPTAVQSGEGLGNVNFFGYGATGYSTARISILGATAENWTDAAQGTYLAFNTTNVGTALLTERMRIDGSGNVGIGTTSPSSQLQVYNAADSQAIVNLAGNRSAASASASIIEFSAPSSPAATDKKNFSIYNINGIASGQNSLVIAAQSDDYSSFTPAMTVMHTGLIGVGTTNPLETLSVASTTSNQGFSVSGAATAGTTASVAIRSNLAAGGFNPLTQTGDMAIIYSGTTIGTPNGLVIAPWSSSANAGIRMNSSGNVGIGTAAPGVLLSNTSTNTLDNSTGAGWNSKGIGWSVGGSGYGETLVNNGTAAGSNGLLVNTAATASTSNIAEFDSNGVVKMIIRADGNVGIANASPAYKLDVGTGDINVATSSNGTGGTYSRVRSDGGLMLRRPQDATTGTINGYIDFYGTSATYSRITYDEAGNRMYFTSNSNASAIFSGSVGIGTTSPAYTLDVNGSVRGTSAYVNSSDVRYKKNIETIPDSLNKILQMRGVTFDWRLDEFPDKKFYDKHDMGVIAQEVETVFPEAVRTDDQGYKSVAYSELVAPLINAMKELYARLVGVESNQSSQARAIASVQEENAQLKRTIDAQAKENAELKATQQKQAVELAKIKAKLGL